MYKKVLKDWSATTNERQKLQAIFVVVTFASLIAAGIVALIDRSLGLQLLNVAYIAALVWVVNFVTWAIYYTATSNNDTVPVAKSRTRRK